MKKSGIGIDGVASALGALGRKGDPVSKEQLTNGLEWRFSATRGAARAAIFQAENAGVIKISVDRMVEIVRDIGD